MWPFKKDPPEPVSMYQLIKCSLLTHKSWCRFCKHRAQLCMMSWDDDLQCVDYKVKCHGEVDSIKLTSPVSEPTKHFNSPFDWARYRFDT